MNTIYQVGARRPAIKRLNEALRENGFDVIAGELFTPHTQMAIRSYQRKIGMIPDGVVSMRVKASLGIVTEKEKAPVKPYQSYKAELVCKIGPFMEKVLADLQQSYRFQSPPLPVGALKLSHNGLRFIYTHEHGPNSTKLHYPGGSSGVTLGPGYDMRYRKADEVIADLTALGISRENSKKAAEGCGLTGDAANNFAKINEHLITLTKEQEMRLLIRKAPDYEVNIKERLYVDLLQHEYDALVSFAYNPGFALANVTELVNTGYIVDAMCEINKRVISKGDIMTGLVHRRMYEISLYLGGIYGHLHYTEALPV